MANSVFIATSLDGFIAREDGGIDWLDRVQLDGEDYGFAAFFDDVDVLVMGRGTYETALGFSMWPYAGKRVIVLTHQQRSSQHGEEFFSGDVVELDLDGANVYVDGGNVIRQFLAAGLIDALTISVVPVLLGTGLPLFENGSERALHLVGSTSWAASGLVQLRYRIDRA